jgi:dTDP-4-dehydrorhamnose reductase
MDKRIGITDHKGRLGRVLYKTFPVVTMSNAHKYDVIIHNGAYTDVDGAEDNILETLAKNVIQTNALRVATDARIILLSTDFVFDGKAGPYKEVDRPRPLGVYGWSKWMAERILYPTDMIVRTTVLYGGHRPDFVSWVLNNFYLDQEFSVSSRMISSPTNVYHLAEALKYIAQKPFKQHVINVAGSQAISRYAFARMIGKVFDKDLSLLNYTTETNFGKAERPKRAGLCISLAQSLGIPIYSVWDGLLMMRKIKHES